MIKGHIYCLLKECNMYVALCSGQKLGEFEGENFCPRAQSRRSRVARSRAENFAFPYLKFFSGARKIKKCKAKFSAGQATPHCGAAGGGSTQVSFFGFMYQIW
jgi:hypothetical protein